ncbi:MAG: hydroxyphenylacetyl-CoA thioesterase PaaI [Burkholderiaceae bacterium]|jgi:acyl-CoA thioesterase
MDAAIEEPNLSEKGDLPDDPTALAQQVGARMYSNDAASRMMGMKIEEIRPGYARLSMRVRPDMLNGHAICHGGFIFTLADSSFAFACNSRNQSTVALGCSIDFLAPAAEGDELVAEAQEQSLAGRTGVYDVAVTRTSGGRIALFRGKSYRIRGEVISTGASDAG